MNNDGYRPLAFCRDCGRDFSGDRLFDRHRVGAHGYTFAEGLRRDPPVEDGRRCLDDDELRTLGFQPLTDDEMRRSERHRRRAGHGVALWTDPAEAQRIRQTFVEPSLSTPLNRVEATEAAKTTVTPTPVQIDLLPGLSGESDAA